MDQVPRLSQPGVGRALAETDGSFLEAVELIKFAIKREVRDEVEGVLCFAALVVAFLDDEGVIARERVVPGSDRLAVADRMAPLLERQLHTEHLQIAHVGAQLQGAVHENRQQRLRRAGVVDDLVREEQRRVALLEALSCSGLLVGDPFKQENQAVDWPSNSWL